MISINLEKMLRKREHNLAIANTIQAIDRRISITNANGKLIMGEESENASNQYPIELSGEVIGWVKGSEKASVIAGLLSHLANQEFEKKTLANELLDKYREITFLYEISHKINASLDVREVTKLVIYEAKKIINTTSGLLILLGTENGAIEIMAEFGERGEKNAKLPLLSKAIVERIMSTGKGEIVNDVSSDSQWAGIPTSVSSLIYVPLKTKDNIIGVIQLSHEEAVSYTSEDLKLLTMLAFQSSSAIENALLHEKQLRESRREALLFRLASQIRHSLDLDTILETTVSEIRSLLQIDRCQFIWYRSQLISPEKIGKNKTHHTYLDNNYGKWEVVKEARQTELNSLVGCYSAIEAGSFTERLLNREILLIDDIRNSSDLVMREFFVSQQFISLFALPIQTRSGAIGAICLGTSKEMRPWSNYEVELLQAVANQLAIALEQAEIYREAASTAVTAQAQAKKLQQTLHELQETQTQLIQSEKMSSLGCLVAGVAHEINNPVNFINGNVSYATQYTKNLLDILHLYAKYYPETAVEIEAEIERIDLEFIIEDLPKVMSSMQVGVDRIREIVSSLRNFSRLDQAEKKPVDIHDGIDSTLMILQHRLKATAVRPEIKVIKEYGELPLVDCYAGQLNQVFMNIISNAIDAVELNTTAGMITISTHAIGGNSETISPSHIAICIRDNGPGIPAEVKKLLFDPFFTTKPVGKGTGLGLSISYQIVVEKHGGILKCLSQMGEGAEFWIEIPVTPSESSQVDLSICDRIINFPATSQTYNYQVQGSC